MPWTESLVALTEGFVDHYRRLRFGRIPELTSHHPIFDWMLSQRDYFQRFHLANVDTIADILRCAKGCFVCAVGEIAEEMGYNVQYLIYRDQPLLRINGIYYDAFFVHGTHHIQDMYLDGKLDETIKVTRLDEIYQQYTLPISDDRSIINRFIQARKNRNSRCS